MPRIVCPNCAARYEVSAEVVGAAGRKVRCVRCGHVWLARAEEEAPPPWPEPPGPRVRDPGEEPPAGARGGAGAEAAPDLAAAATTVSPADADRAGPQAETVARGTEAAAAEPRGSATLLLAWVLSVAVLGGAAWAAIAHRAAVIDAWPASSRLYALFGLDG